ncbi:hypothetical protein ACH5RR_018604 [Cinchona calisaya]|uniref:Gamma-tubulin complex component n=1 Tax=Cinchona calisaya TaxID=153742 RepID=A0ABD2ZQK0_9GENT
MPFRPRSGIDDDDSNGMVSCRMNWSLENGIDARGPTKEWGGVGQYISIKIVQGKEVTVAFQVDASMDLNFQFVESRSLSKNGLVNHAFAAAKAMAGNHVVTSLLEKTTHCANTAIPWNTGKWQQRYSIKDDIPSFLATAAETILTTGKYLNVMRECEHSFQVPAAENSKLTSVGSNHHYLECIKATYDYASAELLNLIKEKEKTTLLKRLNTLKDLEISHTVSDSNESEEQVSITGLETFSLSYKVSV